MAKLNTMFKFNGTFRGTTAVRSKTYGDHIRAKRGTHKPAPVNAAFVESGKKLEIANAYAKVIKNCLDPYRENFKDGTLWSRLVSHFRSQLKEHGQIDFSRLQRFEVFKEHPLHLVLNMHTTLSLNAEGTAQTFILHPSTAPHFKSGKNIDSCQYTIIGIFVKPDSLIARTVSHEERTKTLCKEPISVEFPLSEKGEEFLICVKCEGCNNGIPSTNMRTKGMDIIYIARG